MASIDGGIGSDWLDGTSDDDVMNGFAGLDRIFGGAGNDSLFGGIDGDRLYGQEGNDLLNGGAGSDTLDGGSGFDLADYSTNSALGVDLDLAGGRSTSGTYHDTLIGVEGAIGSPFADNLLGDAGDNLLRGGEGDDYLAGLAGNDTLIGDAGNDTLEGGTGDNWVSYADNATAVQVDLQLDHGHDGSGDDTLTGIAHAIGSNFDDALHGDGEANRLDGLEGDDLIIGREGDDWMRGGAGNDSLYGDDGFDTADFHDASGPILADLALEIASGGAGDDILAGFEALIGSQTSDTLRGNAEANWLNGAGGSDLIEAGAGNDSIFLSSGNDTLSGGAGDDVFVFETPQAAGEITLITDFEMGEALRGQPEFVSISAVSDGEGLYAGEIGIVVSATSTRLHFGLDAVAGADLVIDLAGTFQVGDFAIDPFDRNALLYAPDLNADRHVVGSNAYNFLSAGYGNDTLDGLGGNDTLLAFDGDDLLQGGDGNDFLAPGTGVNVVDGGAGQDRVDFHEARTAVRVDLATGLAELAGQQSQLIDIEDVQGSAHADTLSGDWRANWLIGEGSDDSISGGTGNDTLEGGSGYDRLIGDAGNDVLIGGSDADDMLGGKGDDQYFVDHAADRVLEYIADPEIGGVDLVLSAVDVYFLPDNVENARIANSNGAGSLHGNALDNVLYPGFGSNILNGGAGNDTVNYRLASAGVNVSLGITNPQQTSGSGEDRLSDIENLLGSNYADRLIGNDGDNVLSGGRGNDTLQGGKGMDTASYADADSAVTVSLAITQGQATGGAGRDWLSGLENLTGSNWNDALTGNYTANVLDGGDGIDTLVGGMGDDSYIVDVTGDLVHEQPGQGVDTVISHARTYQLPDNVERGVIALSGKADLTGNAQANTITAGNGNNLIRGGDGSDTVSYAVASGGVIVDLRQTGAQNTVSSGLDTLRSIENLLGSPYADQLTGNQQANRLNGGAGPDTLTGGGGNDVFLMRSAADVGSDEALCDVITDFSPGDRIDLSGIDADTLSNGNQAFDELIATASLFSRAGQLRLSGEYLYGNTDDDEAAEFVIKLNGVSTLSLSDLVL